MNDNDRDRQSREAGDAGPEPEWSDLVRVARFWEVHRAHAAQAFLEAEGIDAFLANAHVSGIAWHYGAAGGGIPLEVRAEDAARARELLASHGELAAEVGALRSEPLEAACPRCGTADPESIELAPRFAPSAFLRLGERLRAMFGGRERRPTGSRRCRSCGLEYQE